jgi:hypothetical protein
VTVQRLFSIFPTGMAGVALVVLRCVVALTLIVETHSVSALGWAHVLDAFAALMGLFLFLGLLTPYCAALCCLVELAFLVVNGIPNGFQLGMSVLTAASIVVLGPRCLLLGCSVFWKEIDQDTSWTEFVIQPSSLMRSSRRLPLRAKLPFCNSAST